MGREGRRPMRIRERDEYEFWDIRGEVNISG